MRRRPRSLLLVATMATAIGSLTACGGGSGDDAIGPDTQSQPISIDAASLADVRLDVRRDPG